MSLFSRGSEAEKILETMGDIFYDYNLVGPKTSLLAGRYQLPLSLAGDVLEVGSWLKVPIDLNKLPKGVFLQDLQDERLLTALRSALRRNVEFRESGPSRALALLTESVARPDKKSVPPSSEFWYFVELDTNSLHGIPRKLGFECLPDPSTLGGFQTLPIPFGFSPGNSFEWFDMSYIVGLLVAGATRTGKSVWIRALLNYLAKWFHPGFFRAALVDLKFGVEFGQFESLPHFEIYSSPENLLSWVESETRRRFGLFRSESSYSILDYNRGGVRLPYWLIVIDEYSAFARLATKEQVKQAELMVAQSAGAGLYWLIATQRPSVDIVTGSLKANLGSRVSFSLASTVDAKVVFDIEEFEQAVRIGCPGRAWAMIGDRILEFQSVFVD